MITVTPGAIVDDGAAMPSANTAGVIGGTVGALLVIILLSVVLMVFAVTVLRQRMSRRKGTCNSCHSMII